MATRTVTGYVTGKTRESIIGMRGDHNKGIQNGKSYNPKDFKKNYGVNERRYVVVKDFTDEECRKMIQFDKDSNNETYADITSVEVRVLRITPSYLDELGDKDSDDWQNMSYQDLCKWTYLRTFSFDKDAYREALDKAVDNTSVSSSLITSAAIDNFTGDVKDGVFYPDCESGDDDIDSFDYYKDTTDGNPDIILNISRYPANKTIKAQYTVDINHYDVGFRFKNKSDEIDFVLKVEINGTVYYYDVGTASTNSRFISGFSQGDVAEMKITKYISSQLCSKEDYVTKVLNNDTSLNFNYKKKAIAKNVLDSIKVSDYPQRPLSKEDMDKFCLVALSLKQDVAETGGSTLKKLSLIAESLVPKFNEKENIEYGLKANTWYPKVNPESNDDKDYLQPSKKYFKISKEVSGGFEKTKLIEYESDENKTAYQKYLEDKNVGISVKSSLDGNNFTQLLKKEIFNEVNELKKYYLTPALEEKYISNNTASQALYSLIGRHLGKKAKTYSDINMDSFTEFYKFCEDVTDGSVEDDGSLIHYKFSCNGIVQQEIKMETLLQKILLTGRASFRRDDENKYEVVIGRKGQYPVLMLNQKNCISMSNSRDFNDKPSGFHCQFIDETDNYNTNEIYIMNDGEVKENPSGDIEEFQIPYVTDRNQLWSLGRSNLGARILQREVYTRTVGKIGYSLSYGDVVLLQDSTLLVGTDNGGRIMEIIQDTEKIYGFTTDEPFHYQGLTDSSGLCTQGVTIVQPSKTGSSRCVTLRLANANKTVEVTKTSETSDTKTNIKINTLQIKDSNKPTGWSSSIPETHNIVKYSMKKGLTNVVLFDKPVSRRTQQSDELTPILDYNNNYETVLVLPKHGDLVAFGSIGNETIKAIVTSIKHQEGEKFQLTLIPYDDSLYEMGGVIPRFDAHMSSSKEESGNVFVGAVTKDDVLTTATSNTAAAISGILETIESITSLYTIDVSPEFQTLSVTQKGKPILDSIYLKVDIGYNKSSIKAVSKNGDGTYSFNYENGSIVENESIKLIAYIGSKEVGEWLIGSEYQTEIERWFTYDGSPVLKVSTSELTEDTTTVSIYFSHITQSGENAKTASASISKISLNQDAFFDMAFPTGAGALKRSKSTTDSWNYYSYSPKKIKVEKRKISLGQETPEYLLSEYGNIEVKYFDENNKEIKVKCDKDGNPIKDELGNDIPLDSNDSDIGSFSKVSSNSTYESYENYNGKFIPFLLKLNNVEDSDGVEVLGFTSAESNIQDDLGVIFYSRVE